MKTIRILFLFILAFILETACMMYKRSSHDVIFWDEACIKPFERYDYRTCDNLRVTIDGNRYVIPKNFKTNLASIPRPLWSFYSPQYSAFIAPAILHDFLYHCPNKLERKFADDVFYSALKTEGVSTPTATKFYIAVRLFGFLHFEKGNQCIPNKLITKEEYELKITTEEDSWMSLPKTLSNTKV